MRSRARCFAFAGILLAANGCSSMQRAAVNKLGDAIAATGTTFAGDDDPELIGDALPFSLKLIESLLAETPRHRGLLIAATRGFTQYSYGWVASEAERLEATDLDRAAAARSRARRLCLRARDYGLRALETRENRNGAFRQVLAIDPRQAVAMTKSVDVPALYWTAAAWGLAISISKDDPELIGDLPIVEALIRRAAELEPTYGNGAIETFLLAYEAARPGARLDEQGARKRFATAIALSDGRLASPYVAFAESVSIQMQNRTEFETLLQSALAVDPHAKPEWRLENILAQRRAAHLLQQSDELFLDVTPEEE